MEELIRKSDARKAVLRDTPASAYNIDRISAVNAIEIAKVEETKQQVLCTIDMFIEEYKRISESAIDHFAGKADAMETARRLINAALTDLCRKD